MAFTQEETDQINKDVEDFKTKSTQYASSSPAFSAYYHRLFLAGSRSLRSLDRAKRSQEKKAYQEQRKQARKGGTPTPSGTAPTASSGTGKSKSA